MGANEKLLARRRAREAWRKRLEERVHRERANAAGAEEIRAILSRVGAVDVWERRRLERAVADIHADAVRRRLVHFRGLMTVIEQMRARGQTLAQIAGLVGVDVHEIRTALRRARKGEEGTPGPLPMSLLNKGCGSAVGSDAESAGVDPLSEDAKKSSSRDRADGAYDPTRCVRCDAVMLDEEAAPRRGRRRLYCSATCRRDASAARTAAQRYGEPVRVVEVPKVAASQKQSAEETGPGDSVAPVDAGTSVLDEALRAVLGRLTEQARLKKLDRATLAAARELSNAVHAHRTW
jgi:hypothetical protein